MSERKAINKYYPPDYDPSKVPKTKKKSNDTIKVRLMAPFSMRCNKCNEYISSSRKFNARKTTTAEKYMGVKIIEFNIRCPICNNVIIFKTHPQSGGYVLVSGATRNFEPKNKPTIPVQETQEQILERLLKEDEENKKYQELKEKRKKNKFWKDNESNDINENLQNKLEQQQRQFEMNEHLEYLQAKSTRLQNKEVKLPTADDTQDEDKFVEEAFAKFSGSKRPLDITHTHTQPKPIVIKRQKMELVKKKEEAPAALVGYSSSEEDE